MKQNVDIQMCTRQQDGLLGERYSPWHDYTEGNEGKGETRGLIDDAKRPGR